MKQPQQVNKNVIKTESLYASKCLVLNPAKQIGEIENKERNIRRKITRLNYDNGEYGKLKVINKSKTKQKELCPW